MTRLLDALVAAYEGEMAAAAPNGGSSQGGANVAGVRPLASMQNKGAEFAELLEEERAMEIISHVVGEDFQFQILNTAWHEAGTKDSPLHSDQWWFPPPQNRERAPRVATGSVTRPGAYESSWHPEPPHDDFIMPSVRAAAIWMATDFTPDNGATRIMREQSHGPFDLSWSFETRTSPTAAQS